MSRPLEDILFAAPSPRAQAVTWAASVIAAMVLLLLAAGIVLRFHSAGQFDARFWKFFAWPTTWAFLGKGLLGTLASAAMAAVIALTFGLVLLLGRLARTRLVRWPSIAVIEFLRGTPTLLLIYVCFLVLPQAGIKMSTYWMLTLPVGLSTAAVVAEVYRAGVLAVPRGQTNAARSLGMTEAQVFFPCRLSPGAALHCPGAGCTTGHRGQGHHLRLCRHLWGADAERQGAHRQLPFAGARVPRGRGALLPGELRDIQSEQTARTADTLTVTGLLTCR